EEALTALGATKTKALATSVIRRGSIRMEPSGAHPERRDNRPRSRPRHPPRLWERECARAGRPRDQPWPIVSAIFAAARVAMAMIVIWGFTPRGPGTVLPSTR